jgi:hypothetical protein
MLWTVFLTLLILWLFWIDQRLHDGWGHSHPAGHRHRRGSDSSASGTTIIGNIWTPAGEGEACGEEGGSKLGKILPNLTIPFSRQGLATDLFTTNLQRGVTLMKRKNIFIGYLVLLMLIATFVACDSTPKQASTGEQVDDSVITTKVKSQLAQDDFLKSFQISVETFKGDVQLSGFVDSQKAVDKAGEITRSVKGVKSVKNSLVVK